SDSSDYSKGVPKEGPSVVSVLEEGTSIQRLLYWYGYNIVEEYLSDTYFPTTDKDTTDKDNTDEDTIHESYSPKQGKREKKDFIWKLIMLLLKLKVASKHLQLTIEACRLQASICICSLHLQFAIAACIYSLQLKLVGCKEAFASCKQAFAACRLLTHLLALTYPFACICSNQT
ncbi:hypothetical protein Tco_1240055, partial [Tanacetum coccineum]